MKSRRGTIEQHGDEKRGEEKCGERLAVWEMIIENNVKNGVIIYLAVLNTTLKNNFSADEN